MKKILYLSIIIFTFSCTSDSNSETDDENGQSEVSFSADIFGAIFERDNAGVTILRDVLTISATIPEPFQNIELRIENVGEGDFSFGDNNHNSQRAIYRDDNDTFIADFRNGSGEMTITNLDLESLLISGTFVFSAREINNGPETVVVNNGSFENLQIDNFSPEIPETLNMFEADIDGIPYRSDEISAIFSESPDNFISITSQNIFTGEQINIAFNENLAPGTYEFNDMDSSQVIASYDFFLNVDATTLLTTDAIDGTLEIFSIDPDTGRIEGTFNFITDNQSAIPTALLVTCDFFSVIPN